LLDAPGVDVALSQYLAVCPAPAKSALAVAILGRAFSDQIAAKYLERNLTGVLPHVDLTAPIEDVAVVALVRALTATGTWAAFHQTLSKLNVGAAAAACIAAPGPSLEGIRSRLTEIFEQTEDEQMRSLVAQKLLRTSWGPTMLSEAMWSSRGALFTPAMVTLMCNVTAATSQVRSNLTLCARSRSVSPEVRLALLDCAAKDKVFSAQVSEFRVLEWLDPVDVRRKLKALRAMVRA
jgi:predicted ribosomally synthesized peptide with SipW-like signal peptide